MRPLSQNTDPCRERERERERERQRGRKRERQRERERKISNEFLFSVGPQFLALTNIHDEERWSSQNRQPIGVVNNQATI
jgi:hypothetical protein